MMLGGIAAQSCPVCNKFDVPPKDLHLQHTCPAQLWRLGLQQQQSRLVTMMPGSTSFPQFHQSPITKCQLAISELSSHSPLCKHDARAISESQNTWYKGYSYIPVTSPVLKWNFKMPIEHLVQSNATVITSWRLQFLKFPHVVRLKTSNIMIKKKETMDNKNSRSGFIRIYKDYKKRD
jgi:hypothetical protein